MSDYLGNLIARSLAVKPIIQPRLVSLFEPPQMGRSLEEKRAVSPEEMDSPPDMGIRPTMVSAPPPRQEAEHTTKVIKPLLSRPGREPSEPRDDLIEQPALVTDDPVNSPKVKPTTEVIKPLFSRPGREPSEPRDDLIEKPAPITDDPVHSPKVKPTTEVIKPRYSRPAREPAGSKSDPMEPPGHVTNDPVHSPKVRPTTEVIKPLYSRPAHEPAGSKSDPMEPPGYVTNDPVHFPKVKPTTEVIKPRYSRPAREPAGSKSDPMEPPGHVTDDPVQPTEAGLPTGHVLAASPANRISPDTGQGKAEIETVETQHALLTLPPDHNGSQEVRPGITPVIERVEDESVTLPIIPLMTAPAPPAKDADRNEFSATPPQTVIRPRVKLEERSQAPVQSAQKEEESTAAPTIRVTIGRVEVRAVMPATPPSRQPVPFTPGISLDDYLKQARSKP